MPSKKEKQNPPGDVEISNETEENTMEETKMQNQEMIDFVFQQKEELIKEKENIENEKIASEKRNKEYVKLLAEKAEIEKSITDIEKFIDDYEKVENNFKGDESALGEYYKDKRKEIIDNKKIKDGDRDLINKKIEEIKKKINKNLYKNQLISEKRFELTLIDQNDIDLYKANKELQLKQKNFEEYKKYQKFIQDKINVIKELKQKVVTQESQGNEEKAYFNLEKLNIEMGDLKQYKDHVFKIRDSKEFREKLYEGLWQLNEAKKKARDAELNLNGSIEEQNKNKMQLEEAEQTFESEIYAEIDRIKNKSGG